MTYSAGIVLAEGLQRLDILGAVGKPKGHLDYHSDGQAISSGWIVRV